MDLTQGSVEPTTATDDAELAAERAASGQRMVAGIRWSLLDQAVQQGMRMVVNVVLARLVAPESFGVLAMALVVTQVSVFVANAGLGPALVHKEQLEKRHVDVAWTVTSLLGTACALLVLVGAGPVSGFFDEPDLTPILAVLSSVFFVKGLHAVPLDLLRRALRFDQTALVSTLATVVASIVGVAMAAAGADVWALVGYSLAEAVVASAAAMVLAARLGVWRPGISFDREAFREVASYGAFVTASRLLGYGVGNFDNAVVGKVLGSTALGYYGLAYRIVLFPIQRIADAVSLVTFPTFARLQGDRQRLRSLYLQSLEAIALVCFPATVGVAVAGPLLVETVFGEEWLPASATMQLLALAGPKLALTRVNSSVFQAVGRPRWDLQLGLFDFALFATGFLIGAQHGVAGVAAGFTIAAYTALPVDLGACAKAIELPLLRIPRAIAPVAVATGLMAAAGLAVRHGVDGWSPAVHLLAVAGAGAAAYVAGLAVVAPGLLGRTIRRFVKR